MKNSWQHGVIGGVVLASIGTTLAPAQAQQATPAGDACASSGDLAYVCGPRNAEDIVRIGDSRWLILSGMSVQAQGGGTATPGQLYLVDHGTKIYESWFPGAMKTRAGPRRSNCRRRKLPVSRVMRSCS